MLLTFKREIITVGIFGSNGKTSTISLLSNIFCYAGLSTNILFDKKDVCDKRKMANIDTYKKLKKTGNDDIIIIEITEDLLKNESLKDVNFDILIHCRISEGSYENSSEGINRINYIINNSKCSKTVILNTDDDNWKDISINLENTFLITYGLGNKATVTASSIECSKDIRFCYCLQRSLSSLSNAVIEPMEIPFLIKATGQYNVYNGLAAITSALICDINIKNIVSSLSSSTIYNIGLNILHENDFMIVDNICDTVLSFDTGFEAVQHFSYNNVYLIFNLNLEHTEKMHNKIIEIIGTWSLILDIKKIFFLDYENSILRSKYYNTFVENLTNTIIKNINLDDEIDEVEKIIDSLQKKDLLLFFCSSDMNYLREKIVEMLDKRILGRLS